MMLRIEKPIWYWKFIAYRFLKLKFKAGSKHSTANHKQYFWSCFKCLCYINYFLGKQSYYFLALSPPSYFKLRLFVYFEIRLRVLEEYLWALSFWELLNVLYRYFFYVICFKKEEKSVSQISKQVLNIDSSILCSRKMQNVSSLYISFERKVVPYRFISVCVSAFLSAD